MIHRIWPAVILHTLFAAAIVAVTELTPYKLAVPNVMLTVLGLVVGFGISYRASQGFDRFNQGRSRWTDTVRISRTLARLVWDHVPEVIDSQPGKETEEERELARNEKKRFIGLILAFAVATKHALRGEEGIFWTDLYDLISWLPQFHDPSTDTPLLSPSHSPKPAFTTRSTSSATPSSPTLRVRPSLPTSFAPSATSSDFSPTSTTPTQTTHFHAAGIAYGTFQRTQTQPLLPSGGNSDTPRGPRVLRSLIFGYSVFSSIFPSLVASQPPSKGSPSPTKEKNPRLAEKCGQPAKGSMKYHPTLVYSRDGRAEHEVVNLPLVIIGEMSGYLACLERRGTVSGTIVGGAYGCLTGFEEALSMMEQILTTPLPVVYSVHLRQTVIIYLFALPAQLVAIASWWTIPVLTIASFLFLGFLAAGEELSQPFGWDANDIDLDLICTSVIRPDLHEIMTHTSPPPSLRSKQWLVSSPTAITDYSPSVSDAGDDDGGDNQRR